MLLYGWGATAQRVDYGPLRRTAVDHEEIFPKGGSGYQAGW
jgi:hypothetical protein